MKNQSIVLTAVLLPLAALVNGCSSSGDGDGGDKVACTSLPVTAGTQPTTCNGATFTVQNASDYSFSSELKLPPQTVKSMSNLTIDWSKVTHDFLGHDMNIATDVNS